MSWGAEGHGGGILNVSSDLASLLAINSTIASNHGDAGSGIENRNVTVTLDHATLTENIRGPALYERTWARNAIVTNSIVAGNWAGHCSAGR